MTSVFAELRASIAELRAVQHQHSVMLAEHAVHIRAVQMNRLIFAAREDLQNRTPLVKVVPACGWIVACAVWGAFGISKELGFDASWRLANWAALFLGSTSGLVVILYRRYHHYAVERGIQELIELMASPIIIPVGHFDSPFFEYEEEEEEEEAAPKSEHVFYETSDLTISVDASILETFIARHEKGQKVSFNRLDWRPMRNETYQELIALGESKNHINRIKCDDGKVRNAFTQDGMRYLYTVMGKRYVTPPLPTASPVPSPPVVGTGRRRDGEL